MRDIKFQYMYELMGVMCKPTLTLKQIEDGLAHPDSFPRSARIIAKRQFTGKIDGEGDGIYQDDIISDNVGVGLVVWDDNNCSFKIRYYRENKGMCKWFRDFLESEMRGLAVIGNIHQHSDLLKG